MMGDGGKKKHSPFSKQESGKFLLSVLELQSKDVVFMMRDLKYFY